MAKKIINYPNSIDLSEFKKGNSTITKYGLPKKIAFCKSCVISNQRPNSAIEHQHTKSSIKKTCPTDNFSNLSNLFGDEVNEITLAPLDKAICAA